MKFKISLFILGVLFLQPGFAQFEQESLNVAIFVHEGVELFDFAGPGEVFVAAGYQSSVFDFNVYTVAASEEEVTSQTFLKIIPNYSIHNCPPPDIIVLPGGNTGIPLKDPTVIDWIKVANENAQLTLSVCTGAFLLGKAELLEGLKATTHWGSIESLRRNYPNTTVLEDTKFIDNGKIITSGGVSSGVEGSLHVVSRMAGKPAAKKVARYMEYNNWDNRTGLVEKENEFISAIKTKGFENALKDASESTAFYGELLNLGAEFLEKGAISKALPILEYLAKEYPVSESFEYLTEGYKKAGKPAPPLRSEIATLFDEGQVEKAIAKLEQATADFPNWIIVSENDMNRAGYRLMNEGQTASAIQIFELNTKIYPHSFNVWDSLAEGYLRNDQPELATKYYKKSIEINPNNTNGKKMLEKIKDGTYH